jgi:hypothetical protein
MRCQYRIYLNKEEADKVGKKLPGWYQCPSETCGGITRCKDFCQHHFSRLKADNQFRHEKDIEITENLKPIKLTKRFTNKLQLDENQKDN